MMKLVVLIPAIAAIKVSNAALSEDNKTTLNEIFSLMDFDKSGGLDQFEFNQVMWSLFNKDGSQIFDKTDADKNGDISQDEFHTAVLELVSQSYHSYLYSDYSDEQKLLDAGMVAAKKFVQDTTPLHTEFTGLKPDKGCISRDAMMANLNIIDAHKHIFQLYCDNHMGPGSAISFVWFMFLKNQFQPVYNSFIGFGPDAQGMIAMNQVIKSMNIKEEHKASMLEFCSNNNVQIPSDKIMFAGFFILKTKFEPLYKQFAEIVPEGKSATTTDAVAEQLRLNDQQKQNLKKFCTEKKLTEVKFLGFCMIKDYFNLQYFQNQ